MRSNRYFADETTKSCYINTDFGQNLACRKFNLTLEELELIVGRYKKGKRKGELKGQLHWTKVINGGWVSGLGLVAPNFTYGYYITDSHTGETIYGEDRREFQKLEVSQKRLKPMLDRMESERQKELLEQQKLATDTYNRLLSELGTKFDCEAQKENEHPKAFYNRVVDWVMDNLDKLAEKMATIA